MRLPWKIIKTRCVWIFLIAVGVSTIIVNVLDLSVTVTAGAPSQGTIQDGEHHVEDNRASLNKFFNIKMRESSGSETDRTTMALSESVNIPARGKEVQHVAFLKLHKAASSTAQNIFLRFGWYRKLTFVLPPSKNPAGYPNIISLRESLTNSNILPPPQNRSYDIMCNHVFYNYDAFKYFMPKDAVFIGILRDPFELYKSILNYFRPLYIFKKIHGNSPASQFLRNPAMYEPKRLASSWTNNRMAIEYGFPEDVIRQYNQSSVEKYLRKLDREFSVMLIAEYMEESIIIMRRYLNWQTKDVIFIDQNVSRRKNESMLSKAFDRDFYKQYAKVDYDFYTYFYRRLKEQIRKEGADFDDELLHFKDLRKSVSEYCKQSEVRTPIEIAETRWGEAFNVTKEDCTEMGRGEIDFITRIRVRQYGRSDI